MYTNDSPQLAASNGHTRGSGRGGGQSRPGGSGGVRDSTDASSEVSGLLALLAPRQDPATKRAALHQIGVLAAQNSLALRPPFFGQVLAVILETLKSDEVRALWACACSVQQALTCTWACSVAVDIVCVAAACRAAGGTAGAAPVAASPGHALRRLC